MPYPAKDEHSSPPIRNTRGGISSAERKGKDDNEDADKADVFVGDAVARAKDDVECGLLYGKREHRGKVTVPSSEDNGI